jgi:hypothetical protein
MSAAPNYLSARLAAVLTGRSRGAIARLLADGTLAAVRPNRRALIDIASLARYRGRPVTPTEYAAAIAHLQRCRARPAVAGPQPINRVQRTRQETSRGHAAAL